MTTIYLSCGTIQVASNPEQVLQAIREARAEGLAEVTFTTLMPNGSGFRSDPLQPSRPMTFFVEHIQGVK